MHYCDPRPMNSDGTELRCYLDGPPSHWLNACSACGWTGHTMPAEPGRVFIDDATLTALSDRFDTEHLFLAVVAALGDTASFVPDRSLPRSDATPTERACTTANRS